MQIVIDIPYGHYLSIKDGCLKDCIKATTEAIVNGTILPKGHGRILDEKEILNTENHDGGWYDLVDLPDYIAGVPEIVEAEKERKS